MQGWTGTVGLDLDTEDAGTINVTTPWTTTPVDSVSIPEVDAEGALVGGRSGYSAVRPDIVVGSVHSNADNLSRRPGITTVATAAWAAGEFGSEDAHALPYRKGHHLPTTFRGAASPGRANYAAAPAAGTLRLNEVHINPPTAVDSAEYVEIISTEPFAPMTSHWLIVLDATAGTGSGIVRKIFDLGSQTTGSNRLALFGDGLADATSPLLPFCAGRTLRDDPVTYNANGTLNTSAGTIFAPDSLQNDGVSILLVTFTGTGLPAAINADLDANNDGLLDGAPAWTLVDGISTGNGIGSVPVAGAPAALTGNLSRHPGNMNAGNSAAWYGGALAGTTATSFGYSADFFGAFKGGASPGRHNVTAPLPSGSAGLLLNEININPPGGDNDKEFIELISTDGSSLSASGYSVLLIDNEGTDTGRILEVYDFDSASTGSNGLLLAGSGYQTAIPWAGAAAPDAATRLFAPDTMAFDDIGGSTNNGALTVVLVRNFTGRAGDDLDRGTQGNANNPDDQVFNTPLPWTALTDSAAMRGYTVTTVAGSPVYSLEGSIFPGTANLTVPIPAAPNEANGYTPDSVARIAGFNTANSSGAWYGGNIAGTAGTATAYTPGQFFPANFGGGRVTPGRANIPVLADTADPDFDNVPHIIELALGMDDFTPDCTGLPRMSETILPGIYADRKQPVFTLVRPAGGVSGLLYSVRASVNLQNWNLALAATQVVQTNTPTAGMETRTYYLEPGSLAEADLAGRIFFKLDVQRQ